MENLKEDRRKFLSLTSPADSYYHDVECKEERILSSARNEIFGRIKRRLSADDEYLQSLVPENLEIYLKEDFLDELKRFRVEAAVKLGHPDAPNFVASLKERMVSGANWYFLNKLYQFAKQFELKIELRQSLADATGRAVEKSSSDHQALLYYARWMISLPATQEKVDGVIKLLDKAIEKQQESVEAENRERASGGIRLRSLQEALLEGLKESREELNRKREGM